MSDLVLVTGASKGIGRATALKLANENVEIIATGRNVVDLESLKNEITKAGGTCHLQPAELNKDTDLDALFDEIKKSGKRLKLLVHSAAVAKVGKVEDMKKADWQDVIETNLSAPFYLTQKCLPLMKSGSQIIFINSRAGKQTFSEWAAEVSVKGIRVTTIYPASVDTPMQAGLPYDWDTSKMMQPEDIAEAVLDCFKQPPNVTITDLELQNPAGIF